MRLQLITCNQQQILQAFFHFLFINPRAASQMDATVMPNFSKRTPAGALAPKLSMPMMTLSSPT
jgi:hypothetical protein